ncbi:MULTISPECIES: ABC transporter permease [Rhizobium/Agrobacterium group]|jgi:iron(III) transport system permease protein|uniref:ABC transporter permease n=2 Tax=Rhizobium/Agrobacterium group TaxID=227290 RepID=A0A1B9UCT5_AGRTU|nr:MULTISPECIES: iron ABC transporter permease [Rhizobium/Agrobacterium group]EHJ95751.1 iron ABC transporter permease [Agrobacterium tumefaciens 5A]ADY67409.1 iron putative ABC transporter permease protein [Agrobacterium tumefaciens]KAA3499683.1 iron ABC transporter permease [Agrobacterium tumefaciens]KAA3522565.1 iron ABC transporter permease [Agrobacterium tumefaciens]KQY40335.1 ABC transporter permease [Rhizobium sp. Root491]
MALLSESTKAEALGRPPATAPSAWQAWRYRLKVALREPTTLIGVLTALLFTYLIVVPIISIVLDAVRVQFGHERRLGKDVGDLTLYYLDRAFFSPVATDLFWHPLFNTLTVALGAIALSLVIGTVLAWLISRTDMFGRRWFATALIVPYMLPAWTFALAWTTLFKNRTVGGQPGWFEAMGLTPPDWVAYGRFPITIILALHYTPFVILLFGSALRRFDSQLEDSARILGAHRYQVALQVILPLMRPALLSSMVLIFAKCLGEFGVPYVLGLPVKFEVLSTSLFRSIASRQTGVAGVVAASIMLIGIITLMIDARLVREARRFVTIGSKGSMNRQSRLGKMRLPATGFAAAVFILSVGLPLLTLALSTVMKMPAKFTFDNFTLDYWIGSNLNTVALQTGVLLSPDLWAAAKNTMMIVGLASLTSGVLGLLVGYVVIRTPVRALSVYLRQVTFLPYLVPGIAFAAAYLSLFAVPRGPMPALYGTVTILILALIADQMPYASRAGISAMTQLGKDPEEAAQIAGAGWFRRMVSIVIPIQKGSLVTGVLLPFISGIKGLSLFVILAVPSTDVLTTYSLRLVDYHYTQAANAVVLIIAGIAYFGTLLAQKLTRTNLAEGLGS